uniref:NAD(P)-binding protein n=1 Tax=Caenorhabditis tropicalis TaxID=1561998 RepID=A0A1I7U7B6_9PELO
MSGTRFAGKVVLITGSSNGIGRACAVLFAGEGAKVVITGRNAEDVEKTRKICLSVGAKQSDLHPTVGDVMDDGFLTILVETVIDTFGKMDILINNAGSLEVDMTGKEGWEMGVDVMERSWNSNFKQVLQLTQKAIPHLIKSRGEIVNVSTFLSSGPIGVMSMPYYAVPKAALDQMSRSMAHEFILKGVRLNTVNPGLVSTAFFSRLPGVGDDNARKMEEYVQSKPEYIPLGRVATAEDVAETILFLADRYYLPRRNILEMK